MNYFVFIILNIIVHIIFFMSIFDIYFTSPLVHGMQAIFPDIDPPARRLVLFVADGLRADKFYELDENGSSRSAYLRNVMLNKGTWGVSHTRVPTESRPGHVALIAGFYEDVSAITKGWKENPVEFDSVFNRSRNTWAFGSPDIVPMFAKGLSGSHVHTYCYEGNIESFAGDDSSILDDWTFNEFESLLLRAKTNQTLNNLLKQNKLVFFLHLLGIDTNGHSHKPMSKEYLSNIRKVDSGIEKVVSLIDNFYSNDQQTTYVFTADHGMTDWGSHGAGLPSETLTPLVVWGAGADKHEIAADDLTSEAIETTRAWKLDPRHRHDVNQADIAPLMSSLLGIPTPINSVGTLPTKYLSLDKQSSAKLMLTNARQIVEQFSVKMKLTKDRSISFTPFAKLPPSEVTNRLRTISDMIKKKQYDEAISTSRDMVNLALEGLQYYHTYHRTYLYFSVVSSFVGWILVSVLVVIQRDSLINSQIDKHRSLHKTSTKNYLKVIFILVAMITVVVTYWLELPVSYFLYFLLPLLIWYFLLKNAYTFQISVWILTCNNSLCQKLISHCCIGLLGIWALVYSFFYRFALLLVLLIFVVYICRTNVSTQMKGLWAFISVILSVFPLLPVVGRSPEPLLVIFGGLFGSMSSYYSRRFLLKDRTMLPIYLLPFLSGCLSSLTSYMSSQYGFVFTSVHFFSWIILLSSWILPLFTSTNVISRMLSIYTCHCASYILISLSYDAIFCVVFCILLCLWLKLEHEISNGSGCVQELDFTENISLENFQLSFHILRRSFLLVFFLVLSFFGVGNIASINSFDVRVVLPFITVFDPFIMGALLAYKVLLPYLLVACAFTCVAVLTKTNLDQLSCFVVILSDVMGMHFFFMVKDQGSWLDIGTTISHYVINMSMILSLLFFFAAAKFFTTRKLWW